MTTAPPDAPAWLARDLARIADAPLGPDVREIGRVERSGDGVAVVSGLASLALDELVEIEGGATGTVLSLERTVANVVLLDHVAAVRAGAAVRATGETVRVPVGEGLLGRVVDPLGRPLDGGPAPAAARRDPVERPAPAIVDRQAVSEPMVTGVLAVDALLALGRGQRELIIGDRATGKTALAVDAIISQKHTGVVCVYVAVGQRATAVERVIEAVRQHGAPERCIFVVAPAAAAPGLQWIAPFAGMTMAEAVRDAGGHALVVIDDLTRHAATHRELALLTGETPGREAYPGDVFYVHARLLERAARLADDRGGGSLTALPIAETDAGNLSAYIPTNLISITDGQIVLDQRLFAAGQRPAVDVGLSVSRVGGKAQHPVLRRLSGRIRLDYAQFLELEMFTRFGGQTDPRVKARMARGRAIRALLAQPRFRVLRTADEVALLAALDEGVFDERAPAAVAALRDRLPEHLDAVAADAVAALEAGGTAADAAVARLVTAVRDLLAAVPDAAGVRP